MNNLDDRESGTCLVEMLEKKEAEEKEKFRKEKEELLKTLGEYEIISIEEPAACSECQSKKSHMA